MDLYAENILDHYKHPRHKTAVEGATAEHEERNLSCGDSVTVRVRLDGDRIAAIGWSGEGCAVSQAAMSMLAEHLQGKTLADVAALRAHGVRTMLGVPISLRRSKCAFLGLHALHNLRHRYRGEPDQEWANTVADA